ncbi:MAG: HD domain-containing protein [Candidatus Hodarchaeales archaeon]
MFTRSLNEQEQDILLKIQEFVKKCHAKSNSHDYAHVFKVTRSSIVISKQIDEPVDPFIVIAGALLHDIGKTNSIFSDFHGLFGGSIAEEFLDGLQLDTDIRDKICRVVIRHTPTSMIPPDTPEEKVVFDADTLDRLGLMGLLRGFIGKEGSMQDILEKYLERRKLDYEKLHYDVSRELGMGEAQELEGFSALIKKRLDDRMRSIEDIFAKEGLIDRKHKPAFKKKSKRGRKK